MSILHSSRKNTADVRAVGVMIGNEAFTVCLSDGRQITTPYPCFPRLEAATTQQRAHFEVYANGQLLHWPEIDEDIEVQHIVTGRTPVKESVRTPIGAKPRAKYGKRPRQMEPALMEVSP